MTELLAAAKTDIGRRKVNQDAYSLHVTDNGIYQALFAVLCDGAGGLTHAEVASGLVVRAFRQWFSNQSMSLLTMRPTAQSLFAEWEEVLSQVNGQIYQYGLQHQIQLGTTAVVLLAVQGQYYILNVGDSRFYSLKDQALRITRDHTYAQLAVEQHQLRPEDAMSDPRRRVLFRCIGAEETVLGDYFTGAFTPGDYYLLCTDGFYHTLSEDELGVGLSDHPPENDAAARLWLEDRFALIRQRGETDNMTALLFRAGDELGPTERTVDLRRGIQICRQATSLQE